MEGEYTHLHEPARDRVMLAALAQRGLRPEGVPATRLYHLVGRDTANPDHPALARFCLRFADLSPHAVAAILDMTEPQQDRFFRAYDLARRFAREVGIFPRRGPDGRPLPEEEKEALAWDEFDTGYPGLTLGFVLDFVGACLHAANKAEGAFDFYVPALAERAAEITKRIAALKPDNPTSWRVLHSKLWRLHRLRVFDHPQAPPLDAATLVRPGQVSIIDLSDSDSPVLSNLAIASLLRSVQRGQDAAYEAALRDGREPPRTLVVIEEAHEFLSAARVDRVPVLFEQVERIAKRGRKRWLGLCFVTQLPQHLPPQLLGLVNNFILHKVTDTHVIERLQRTVPGIDGSLWRRLPGLAPGQAIVSLASMTRPLLVSMDPAPCALRLTE